MKISNKYVPKAFLNEERTRHGLQNVLWDGVTTEILTTLTGGVFLVSLALLIGANNKDIGLLAAWPLLGNITQLSIVALLQKYRNRKIITLGLLFLARVPLVLIGLVIVGNLSYDIHFFMFAMAIHYTCSAAAGLTWNSWVKDLVPAEDLGRYFSKRSKYMLVVNLCVSLVLALGLDLIKDRYPDLELYFYGILFAIAGISGFIGMRMLARTDEPFLPVDKIAFDKLLTKPFKDINFKRLLWFNSAWLFAVNIATPFFVVFMLKELGMSMTYIIVLTLIGQFSSILTVRLWGSLSDKYSNKNIILILAPLYILTLIIWVFVGLHSGVYVNALLLITIYVITGVSNSGINLALTNIGLKLIPSKDATIYLSVRTIITSVVAAAGPLLGGYLADVFQEIDVKLSFEWDSPRFNQHFKLVYLHGMNFLFIISALTCLISLQLLNGVKEMGEVNTNILRKMMRKRIKSRVRESFVFGNIQVITNNVKAIVKRKQAADGQHNTTEEEKV